MQAFNCSGDKKIRMIELPGGENSIVAHMNVSEEETHSDFGTHVLGSGHKGSPTQLGGGEGKC